MEGTQSASWIFWALLSAVFAALTAIFAKIGLEDIDSDLATLFRTFVIIIVLGGFVYLAGKWTNPLQFKCWNIDDARPVRPRYRSVVDLLFSRVEDR